MNASCSFYLQGIDRSSDGLGTRQELGCMGFLRGRPLTTFRKRPEYILWLNKIVVRIMKTGGICELSWNMFYNVTVYNSINECHTRFGCTRHTRVVATCIEVKYSR